MDYLSIQDVSEKWGISKRRIQILCKTGRINGSKMIGNMWVVPYNAERPTDARTKTPVKEKHVNASLRNELKKLLKTMKNHCLRIGIEDAKLKMYILSILSAVLCEYYTKAEFSLIFKTICNDFKIDSRQEPNSEMLCIVRKFVEKANQGEDLDNVLSWAYQYSNKIVEVNLFEKTQFFTEKYMIKYLLQQIPQIVIANKILDPCVGGGNFLAECMEILMNYHETEEINEMVKVADKIFGYDIDPQISKVALVNIRLRTMKVLAKKQVVDSFLYWEKICPNIFCSYSEDFIEGALKLSEKKVINILSGESWEISDVLSKANVLVTNPPFATVKGMPQEQKKFLKELYPDTNCDMCVAFIDAIYRMLDIQGVCGIVSQNSWMHLKTFEKIREKFTNEYLIKNIANLGSGAFLDLNGEKTNVSLIVLSKEFYQNNKIKVLNLENHSFAEKVNLLDENDYIEVLQDKINGNNGYEFYQENIITHMTSMGECYKNFAVPMQGTSTGNAKELVGFFWEHFNDNEWRLVSNGGGYCRWEGLNNSVVKWGKEGEYIKEQKGSALRNIKYFEETKLVYSDTGTAGLNVRILLPGQIFIASGPGIRTMKGNYLSQLAFLNSRLASYFIRKVSPKLTIAAGYIGQIPVLNEISSSEVLANYAQICIGLKRNILSLRPNTYEYDNKRFERLSGDLNTLAWTIFHEDITNELMKLEIEGKIDRKIIEEYGLNKEERTQLLKSVGECAYYIDEVSEIDVKKLDKYLSNIIGNDCMLRRTRVSKEGLGCDGLIEYSSKELHINPEKLVKIIQDNAYAMSYVLEKYRNLILHNTILGILEYDIVRGVGLTTMEEEKLCEKLNRRFTGMGEISNWINVKFNDLHSDIFKNKPFVEFNNKEKKICVR